MKFNTNISYNDVISLLEDNPQVTKTFRYYLNREPSCFLNHLYHFICEDNGEIIGYGHLDYEEKLWLGMFVVDSKVGMGYGKQILLQLINNANQDLHLTVDKNNLSAVNLYLGKGFKIYNQTEKIYYCKLRKQNG